jgi:hypothetical protein
MTTPVRHVLPVPFAGHRGTGFAGPQVAPPLGAEDRGSKPAGAGLDGSEERPRLAVAPGAEGASGGV